ncbi:hypothetical protein [Pseudoroseicyclus tamaricis]|uniref:Uncharacterized protein n=1 Tax=Pseudoroseicyclus tamaricis TaxID=2705421 RepID=A0A6B2JM91_9RHOB|nr:hypothetical protein [Pseudoroseicyclus tamaricis]NDV02703.1 hypothetical protein [Pseudoroseicyclus tamaricis]
MTRLILAAAISAGLALPAMAQEVAPEAPPQVVEATAGFAGQTRPLLYMLAGAVALILVAASSDSSSDGGE